MQCEWSLPCHLQRWWLLISSEHVFVILFWARQMKMWMSKPTKTAFFSLIISSSLDEVTSYPHVLNSQRKALELDLEKFNNNFTGGLIAVYWDMGLTENSVLRATLAVVLRTKCETQWNYHYVTRARWCSGKQIRQSGGDNASDDVMVCRDQRWLLGGEFILVVVFE